MLNFYEKTALLETVYSSHINEPDKLTIKDVYKTKQRDALIELIKTLEWIPQATSTDGGYFFDVVATNPKHDNKKLLSKLYQAVKKIRTEG